MGCEPQVVIEEPVVADEDDDEGPAADYSVPLETLTNDSDVTPMVQRLSLRAVCECMCVSDVECEPGNSREPTLVGCCDAVPCQLRAAH